MSRPSNSLSESLCAGSLPCVGTDGWNVLFSQPEKIFRVQGEPLNVQIRSNTSPLRSRPSQHNNRATPNGRSMGSNGQGSEVKIWPRVHAVHSSGARPVRLDH